MLVCHLPGSDGASGAKDVDAAALLRKNPRFAKIPRGTRPSACIGGRPGTRAIVARRAEAGAIHGGELRCVAVVVRGTRLYFRHCGATGAERTDGTGDTFCGSGGGTSDALVFSRDAVGTTASWVMLPICAAFTHGDGFPRGGRGTPHTGSTGTATRHRAQNAHVRFCSKQWAIQEKSVVTPVTCFVEFWVERKLNVRVMGVRRQEEQVST